MQQTLFDTFSDVIISPKEEIRESKEKPKIGWSFSKMEMLDSCPRKYYYNYFASSKRKSKDENREEIAVFKNVFNVHIIVGDIVHESIAVFLRKLKNKDEWSFERLLWLAHTKLQDIVNDTIKLKNGQQKSSIKICKEIYDDVSKKDEIYELAIEKINQCLTLFNETKDFDFIINSALELDTIIENPAKFKLDNISIDGKIDVAFTENGKFHIVDWKTSYSDYEETSVQLLVYALWAIEKHGRKIEEICIHKAYLLDGKIETLEFSQKHLERAKAKIRQSVDEMTILEKYGLEGIIEAFDHCYDEDNDERNACKLCSFEKICKSSKLN